MENVFYYKNWYDDLCEYYGVSPDVALELGTRKPNRKPSLPASATTHAVSNLTFEEIWASKPRDSEEQIFQFYKDQGAWSAFRQVVRHKDMTQVHLEFLTRTVKRNSVFCEYGCGVAPFTYTLLENIDPAEKLSVHISDVESEHFTFGAWRLKKLIESRNLRNVTFEPITILPNSLPQYSEKLDAVFIFEVLEHVPSPVATLENLTAQMKQGGLFCENFIKHAHDPNEQPGPDLDSAAEQRDLYYQNLDKDFKLLLGETPDRQPNQTRIWEKL
jgi:hypothetical protein